MNCHHRREPFFICGLSCVRVMLVCSFSLFAIMLLHIKNAFIRKSSPRYGYRGVGRRMQCIALIYYQYHIELISPVSRFIASTVAPCGASCERVKERGGIGKLKKRCQKQQECHVNGVGEMMTTIHILPLFDNVWDLRFQLFNLILNPRLSSIFGTNETEILLTCQASILHILTCCWHFSNS